jgi:lambda repressor-like predicted transcriptional regulator
MIISSISSATTTNVQWQSTQRPDRPNFDKDMQAVADLLGVSTDDLKSELQSGKSLADVAQEQGVSRDDLVSTLEKSMQANAPADVPSDFASHIDDIANKIVDQKGGVHGAHGHGHGHRPPQADDVSSTDFAAKAQQMLETIATQLKMSPTDLLSQLQQGTSLQSIANNAGTDTSTLLDSIGRGLAVNVLA